MDDNEFRICRHTAADWGVVYGRSLRNLPVRAQTTPWTTFDVLASDTPEVPESMDALCLQGVFRRSLMLRPAASDATSATL